MKRHEKVEAKPIVAANVDHTLPDEQRMEEFASQQSDSGMEDGSLLSAAESALEVESDLDLRVPYYCEENVWRLAHRKIHLQCEEVTRKYFVIFISNTIKNVPMFQQRASDDPDKACCWDYHVILVSTDSPQLEDDAMNDDNAGTIHVWDIDSRLSYPCPLQEYLTNSFPYEWPLPYAPLFRVVPAAFYLSHFSSDRMHMFNSQTQTWNAPPPPYRSILSGSTASNLSDYLDLGGKGWKRNEQQPALGVVLTLEQLKLHNFSNI